MYGVTLILTLVLVGGIIAYIGDKIGMKVGRKKLSLFGLRPKHTSILVTIITGFVIASASILALTMVSEDVRTALFHMKEIQVALVESQNNYKVAESRMLEIQDLLTVKEKQVGDLESQIVEKNTKLEEMNSELATTQEKLIAQEKRLKNLEEIGQRLQNKIEELKAQESDFQATLIDLAEQYSKYYVGFERLQQGDFSYQVDEIVGAKAFIGGIPEAEARTQLRKLLEDADKRAIARGAINEQQPGTALQFGSDHFYQTAYVISQSKGKIIVRVKSVGNSLVGEPVLVGFELHENAKIFGKGDTVASKVIDSREDDSDNQVLTLLSEASSVIIRKGMITSEDGKLGKIIGGEDYLETLSRLKGIEGKAKVSVIASNDIWRASGPPEVTLVVEKIE